MDGLNNSFITCKWGASYTIDIAHWKKFTAFAPIAWKVMQAHGRSGPFPTIPSFKHAVTTMPVLCYMYKDMAGKL